MRKIALILIFVFAGVIAAPAQVPTMEGVSSFTGDPPNIIMLYREQVKPSMVRPHMRFESNWTAMADKMQLPQPYIALTSLSGPFESWVFQGFESYAALDKAEQWWRQHAKETEKLFTLGEQDGQHLDNFTALELRYSNSSA